MKPLIARKSQVHFTLVTVGNLSGSTVMILPFVTTRDCSLLESESW